MENIENLSELLQAEKEIREDNFGQALKRLGALAQAEPENGRIAFDLGNIALFQKENLLAQRYYEKALELGYSGFSVYENMAVLKERTEEWGLAGELFARAVELAEHPRDRMFALSALALYYKRRHMLLKAEKTARQMIEEYPQEYQGHHLYILMQMERKHFRDVEEYFDRIQPEFGRDSRYLTDVIGYLEAEGRDEDTLERIDTDPAMMEVIPQLALKKKVQLLLKKENRNEAAEAIGALFYNFEDPDAAFSMIILEMLNGNYPKAGAIANYVMQKEREKAEPGQYFYLAMYLQIYVFYLASDRKPDERVRMLMKKEAEVILQWLEEEKTEIKFQDAFLREFTEGC